MLITSTIYKTGWGNRMKIRPSIGDIKSQSLDMLGGRWTTAVILTLFYALFNGVVYGLQIYLAEAKAALIIMAVLLSFLESFLDLGLRLGMLRYSRNDVPTVGCIFDAAKYYWKALLYYIPANVLGYLMNRGMLWLSEYLADSSSSAMAYGLLLPVAGVLFGSAILLAGFMPMLYLIIDNPGMGIGKLYAAAWRLMKGNKLKLVLLQLSFFGWILLSMVTCGIGMLFVIPYMYVAECTFYNHLIDEERERMLPAEEQGEKPQPLDSSEQ